MPNFRGSVGSDPDFVRLRSLVGVEMSLDKNFEGVAALLLGGKLLDAPFQIGEGAQPFE